MSSDARLSLARQTLTPLTVTQLFRLLPETKSLETLIGGGSLKVVLPLPIWGSKGQDLTETLSH